MRRALILLLLAPVVVTGCNLFAAPCNTAADCDEGACVEGFCDPSTAPPDDAGTPPRDAGDAPDAGDPRDGGNVLDAGNPTDAGPADAGIGTDAGPQPSYASTLDNADAVLNPLSGDGSGYTLKTVTEPAFFADITEQPPRPSLLLDALDELLALPVAVNNATNADLRVGSLTVDYQPRYSQSDGVNHMIFSLEDPGVSPPASLRARKAAGDNNALQLTADDGNTELIVTVPTSSVELVLGQWHRLHFTWDFRGDHGEAHVYVDGQEVGATDANALPVVFRQPDAVQQLIVGGRRELIGHNALARFDNLEVWREVRQPPP